MRKMGYFISENPERKKKWTHLTEGLDDERRLQCEVLMDNQDALNRRILHEATTSAATNVGTVIPGSLGLIREVFPTMIAQELLSIQPSPLPDSRVFFLNFKAGTTKGAVTVNDKFSAIGRDGKDFASRTLETDAIMDVYFDIDSQLISAEEKALKAKWTMRAQQDLMAYRGLNAEDELTAFMGQQIVREWDVNLIDMMADGATAGNVNWCTEIPGTGVWANIVDPDMYKKTLYHAMVDANNMIYKKRYRNATWAVADTDTCARLEKLENFKLNPSFNPDVTEIGVQLLGILNNRWKIYKNPWYAENSILMGYKGQQWFETGAVFMPYIPFWATPVLIDPDDLIPRKGVMSRNGKAVLLGDCYATVTLTAS